MCSSCATKFCQRQQRAGATHDWERAAQGSAPWAVGGKASIATPPRPEAYTDFSKPHTRFEAARAADGTADAAVAVATLAHHPRISQTPAIAPRPVHKFLHRVEFHFGYWRASQAPPLAWSRSGRSTASFAAPPQPGPSLPRGPRRLTSPLRAVKRAQGSAMHLRVGLVALLALLAGAVAKEPVELSSSAIFFYE